MSYNYCNMVLFKSYIVYVYCILKHTQHLFLTNACHFRISFQVEFYIVSFEKLSFEKNILLVWDVQYTYIYILVRVFRYFYCKFATASICSHSTLFTVHSKLQTSCPMPGGNGSTRNFLLAEFMTYKSYIAFSCIFYIYWLCVDFSSVTGQ